MNGYSALWQRARRASGSLAFAQTISYYAAFIALGLSTGSLGPTLPNLADNTASTLRDISILFAARALGYVIGAFVGGRVYDRLPGHRTMALGLVGMAVLLALVPVVTVLYALVLAFLVIGAMEGVVDVGANTLIVWVHRQNVGPYMNALHFCFGVGAFLVPLMVLQAVALFGNFQWAYWLLALLLLPITLRLLPLPDPPRLIQSDAPAEIHTRAASLLPVALFAVFFLLVSGAEMAFGGWIYTYGTSTALTDEAGGRLLTSFFWGAFTLGRLLSIPLALRVRPRVILFGDLLGALASLAVILLWPASPIALWLGAFSFGLAIASAFPMMMTFAGRHLTITGTVTGWFFVGSSIGAMAQPWLIGQLFERIGPAVALLIPLLAIGAGLVVLAVVLVRVGKG